MRIRGHEQIIAENILAKVLFAGRDANNSPGLGSVKDFNEEWDAEKNKWVYKIGGLYTILFQTGLKSVFPGKWV